jgi:hypothetical protein
MKGLLASRFKVTTIGVALAKVLYMMVIYDND